MSEIQKINLNDIDFKWDKVSTTAAGAASGKGFLNESNIIKDAWADELEMEKVDDAYLLSQDGTPMGFIDSKTAEDYMNSEKAAHKQSNKAVDNGNNNIEKKPLTDALKEKGVLSDPAEKKAEIAETINNNLKVDETNSNQIENTKNNLNKSLIDALREKGLLLDPNKEKVDITENLMKNLKIDDNESKISPVVDDSTINIPSIENVDVKTTRYADSTVWYAVIPKELKPKLAIANDNYDELTVEAPSEIAKRKNAKIAINFGLTGDPAGLMYADGKFIGSVNDCDQTLYMDQDGTLNCIRNEEEADLAQKIKDINPVWASKGFYAIAEDGNYVDENYIDPSLSRNKEPRTFIGQDYDGNYIIGVCDGRSENEAGMTLKEVYDFVNTEVTDNLRFLFNGDGGGSSAIMYDGQKLNPDIDGSERERPDLIYWN